MKIVLALVTIVTFGMAALVLTNAKSALHEIEAFILGLASVMALTGVGVIEAIQALRRDLQTKTPPTTQPTTAQPTPRRATAQTMTQPTTPPKLPPKTANPSSDEPSVARATFREPAKKASANTWALICRLAGKAAAVWAAFRRLIGKAAANSWAKVREPWVE